MKINALYFAQLADIAGKKSESLEIEDSSPETVFELAKSRYGFPHKFNEIQVAINHQLSAHQTLLQDGDEIAFLPPMNGG